MADEIRRMSMESLPEDVQQNLRDIFEGSFTEMRADTGLTYPTKAKMIYVQLDKCLKQFREGKNAEATDGKPDQLQSWLAMIADANDEKVRDAARSDEILSRIQKEMSDMAQDREVRNMLMQEKFDRMDWISYGNEQREEQEEEDAKKISEAFGIPIEQVRAVLKERSEQYIAPRKD